MSEPNTHSTQGTPMSAPATTTPETPTWGWKHLTESDPDALRAMARERGNTGTNRDIVNMLRHEFTCYDDKVRDYATGSLYTEIMDAIASDFPWLANQVAYDKSLHDERLPDWVQAKRRAHVDGQAKQRAGRTAAKRLAVGDHVTLPWRGTHANAVVTEVRRSRIKVRIVDAGRDLNKIVDRPADVVTPKGLST